MKILLAILPYWAPVLPPVGLARLKSFLNASCQVENTFLWRKSALYRVRLGVESGSQRVLDLMHKGITVEQILKTVTAFALAGVKTTTKEIFDADLRWKKLQKFAIPPLDEFSDPHDLIKENLKSRITAGGCSVDDGDFNL